MFFDIEKDPLCSMGGYQTHGVIYEVIQEILGKMELRYVHFVANNVKFTHKAYSLMEMNTI